MGRANGREKLCGGDSASQGAERGQWRQGEGRSEISVCLVGGRCPGRWLSFKNKTKRRSVCEDVEELGPMCVAGGNVRWGQLCEPLRASSEVRESLRDLAVSLLRICPQRNENGY